ncbi:MULTISPECIES: hypothetical protein [unclassified Acinetobacter]|uniref:hypothetical protein n=1 Tax=unclassified Acinetobacter TaxID=196816 RepID=UPI00148A5157|nr:hypothetical protein [Acinetobacter sp. ANC 4218]
MQLGTADDPHVKITISVPSSVMKVLEDEQNRIAKQMGFIPPMSRMISAYLRKQLMPEK